MTPDGKAMVVGSTVYQYIRQGDKVIRLRDIVSSDRQYRGKNTPAIGLQQECGSRSSAASWVYAKGNNREDNENNNQDDGKLK